LSVAQNASNPSRSKTSTGIWSRASLHPDEIPEGDAAAEACDNSEPIEHADSPHAYRSFDRCLKDRPNAMISINTGFLF